MQIGYLPDILAARTSKFYLLQKEKEEIELQVWCLKHPTHQTALGVVGNNKDPILSRLELEEKLEVLNAEITTSRIEVQNILREMGGSLQAVPFEDGSLFSQGA